ncbi:MAG: hypothetical protein NTV43_02075 [Methylococcales bacterium]|nr:hypothetical protein [Methylococcales bacterium]
MVEAQAVDSVYELSHITALSGYPCFYRIKFDYRYRMGLYSDGEHLEYLKKFP